VIELEQVAGCDAERSLYEALYARLPIPELSRREWPPPAGIVAGRRDGELMGWVVFLADVERDGEAVLQWILVDREQQRIALGRNTEHRVTDDEAEVLVALVGAAAEAARRAGYGAVRWWNAEPGFAETLAERTGAQRADGAYRLTL